MEDSILKSTKKILGVGEDETPFDLDILTHINSAFSIVSQIGVTDPTFFVEDENNNWSDLNMSQDLLGMLKSYIFLNVKMLFDPPTLSFLLEKMQSQLDEHLIRMSYLREGTVDGDSVSVITGESATGTISIASTIWIMNHNLGFNPAGFRFTTLDGLNELVPESIEYITVNRAIATWPEAIAGTWITS